MMKLNLTTLVLLALLACSCGRAPSSPTPDRRHPGHHSAGTEVQASSSTVSGLTNRLTQLGFRLQPEDHRQSEGIDWQTWRGTYRNMSNMSVGLTSHPDGRLQIRLGSGKNVPANAPAQLRHFLKTEINPIVEQKSEQAESTVPSKAAPSASSDVR